MMEIRDVSKQFGKFQVLRHVNISFQAGQCVALIGPNACGKTTLIKCILGMVIPTSGQIFFGGKSIAHQYDYRHALGYMPQKGRYPDHMTIGQVMAMIKDMRDSQAPFDDELVYEFKLQDMLHKKMRTLSGGTIQKVSAALAFMFNPEVLILDEPTAGLDPVSAEVLKEKIRMENKKGKLVIITSHLLSELDDLISHVIMMQDGAIRFSMPLLKLKNETQTHSLSKAITHILQHDTPQHH
jgi:Cu-processing system ATP-binding protein